MHFRHYVLRHRCTGQPAVGRASRRRITCQLPRHRIRSKLKIARLFQCFFNLLMSLRSYRSRQPATQPVGEVVFWMRHGPGRRITAFRICVTVIHIHPELRDEAKKIAPFRFVHTSPTTTSVRCAFSNQRWREYGCEDDVYGYTTLLAMYQLEGYLRG